MVSTVTEVVSTKNNLESTQNNHAAFLLDPYIPTRVLQLIIADYLYKPLPNEKDSEEMYVFILHQRSIQLIVPCFKITVQINQYQTLIFNRILYDINHLRERTDLKLQYANELHKSCFWLYQNFKGSLEERLKAFANARFRVNEGKPTIAFINWCRIDNAVLLMRFTSSQRVREATISHFGDFAKETGQAMPENDRIRGLKALIRTGNPLNVFIYSKDRKVIEIVPLITVAPPNIIKILVSLGVDINSKVNANTRSSLHFYMDKYYNGESTLFDFLVWLVEQGAQVDQQIMQHLGTKFSTILRSFRQEQYQFERYLENANRDSIDLYNHIQSLKKLKTEENDHTLSANIRHYEQVILQRILRDLKANSIQNSMNEEVLFETIDAIIEAPISLESKLTQIAEMLKTTINNQVAFHGIVEANNIALLKLFN